MQHEALQRLAVDLYGQPRNLMILRALFILLCRDGTRLALVLIRGIQYADALGLRFVQWRLAHRLRREFGCFVQASADIGAGLKLPHPQGIVIGAGVKVGSRCTLYHQVTLGGARMGDWQAGRYPQLGDGVCVFAGAKLIGDITVGDGVIVGANAVVLHDMPAHHAAIGIPARAKPLADQPASKVRMVSSNA